MIKHCVLLNYNIIKLLSHKLVLSNKQCTDKIVFFMPWRFSLSAFKDLKNNFKYTNYFFFWVLRMVLNTGIQVIYLLELSHDITVSSFVFIHLIFDCRRMYCSGPSCLQVSAEGITGVHHHARLSFIVAFPISPS